MVACHGQHRCFTIGGDDAPDVRCEHARQAGEPVILDAAQMAEVLEKFKSYGKQPDRGN